MKKKLNGFVCCLMVILFLSSPVSASSFGENDVNYRENTSAVLAERRISASSYINGLYTKCLNRAPKPTSVSSSYSEVQFWMVQYASGACTTGDMAWSFMLGPEFVKRGVSNATFVSLLYSALLNRSSDSAGYSHWIDQLGTRSRTSVIQSFIATPEFKDIKLV